MSGLVPVNEGPKKGKVLARIEELAAVFFWLEGQDKSKGKKPA